MVNCKRNIFPVVVFLMVFMLTGVETVMAANQKPIKIASVSWTGVTIKTELAVTILNSLGYKAENIMVSVPIAYKAMDSGEVDLFLGNWMPSMKTIAEKYFEKGTVIQYAANMPGAKYTLAVPSYCYTAGLQHFSDIHRFRDKLESKIYGIEAGNDGNKIIQTMIDRNMYDLKDFNLIESSAAGMLAQVQSFVQDRKWIVFLGWAPHYMNKVIDMTYLEGSTDETFGPDDGTATVYTNIRKGFDTEYPNVAVFLKNYTFPISMINDIMTLLHKNRELEPAQAGLMWLKSHPERYQSWLKNVNTINGKPASTAFEAALLKSPKKTE